ncbi:hypothetical protein BGZ94_005476 [Podila epigama]|nr:hypothetical protein BGZ94_005476 [Podila epigama]
MPTVFLPDDQFLTKFVLSTVVILFGTTFSLMFLFLPKLWELFTQIERAQQNKNNIANGSPGVMGGIGGGGGGVGGLQEASGDSSLDGFIYNSAGWAQGSGPEAVASGNAVAAAAAIVAGGSGIGGGSTNGGSIYLGGRKGSVGTLDESKGDTLKETHMGYMGVKFQNRYLPFLASWNMRRIILYPAGRYFTCFELGKPETGRTFTYVNVLIHSRQPGRYILQIIGSGRRDFLLQVRDEERLMYWFGLFENNKQSTVGSQHLNNSSSHLYSIGSSIAGLGSLMPLGNLSASGNIHQHRSESDQTLYPGSGGVTVQVDGPNESGYTGNNNEEHQHQHVHPLDRPYQAPSSEQLDSSNTNSPMATTLSTSTPTPQTLVIPDAPSPLHHLGRRHHPQRFESNEVLEMRARHAESP